MKITKNFIIGTTIAVTLIALFVGVYLYRQRTIGNIGRIKAVGIEVYSNVDCTTKLTSINWGEIDAGKTAQYTLYTKNEGNTNVKLTIKTNNYNPSESQSSLILTWNYDNSIITPKNVKQITFNLYIPVEPEYYGNFSFDIIITGVET